MILLDDCGELLGVSDDEVDKLDGDSILEGIEGEEEIDETAKLNQVNSIYILTKTQYNESIIHRNSNSIRLKHSKGL